MIFGLTTGRRQRFFMICLCLAMTLLTSACIVQTATLSETIPTKALTPETTATIAPEFADLLEHLPTELAEVAGEVPILYTPAALQSESTPAVPLFTPSAATTPTPIPSFCGRSDAITLLILGIDENAQADAIRLARIDFSKPEINMVAIPRDFYVSVVGFEQYGIEQGRINATFGYGEYFLGAGSGAESLAENLTYNFGVQVDHKFVLHLEEIAGYIDAVGGVDLTLDAPASDAFNYFPAGVNRFDGERAVAFMRIREYDSDFRRIDRQTMVLKALLDKVRNDLSPTKVLSLIVAMLKDDSTQSDLTLGDLQNFYCLSQQIDKNDIHVREIPSEMFHTWITPSGGWVLIPHVEIPDYIRESLIP